MARRTGRDASSDSAESASSTDSPTEEGAVMTTDTAEAAVETVPPTDEPTGSTDETNIETPAAESAEPTAEGVTKVPPKAPVDLTPFIEAANTAVEQRDSTTGDLHIDAVAPVVSVYRGLDGMAAKNKAKTFLSEQMREAMDSLDVQKARAFMVLGDNVASGPSTRATVPTDPTEAYVQRKVTLQVGLALLVKGDGVADDAEAQADTLYGEVYAPAQSYLEWLNSDADPKPAEPELPAFVKNAVKLSLGKSVAGKVGRPAGSGGGGSGDGIRHDIGEHIRQAFADKNSGDFMLISEIRANKSTEYGEELPSAGAISARLFPPNGKNCTLDFVSPATNAAGNRGATKN